MDEIKQVTGWKIGRRIYVSQKSALRSLAWIKLDRKYVPKKFTEPDEQTGTLYDVIEAGIGLTCDCVDDRDFGEGFTFVDRSMCPIHANKDGYFCRVVERFKRRYATE